MEKRKFFTNTVILIIIVLAAFFGYRYFFVGSDSAPEGVGLVSDSLIEGNISQANNEFLVLLEELNAVKLERTIFDNPAYQALINFSEPLPEQNKGRVNPFAPLGVNPPRPAAAPAEDSEEAGSR